MPSTLETLLLKHIPAKRQASDMCGEQEGYLLLISKTLYGLKSSVLRFNGIHDLVISGFMCIGVTVEISL